MKSTLNGITIADKLDHGPPLKHLERVVYFEGPREKRGDVSIREMPDGTMRVQLFNLPADTKVVCPDGNYISTRAKREAARST